MRDHERPYRLFISYAHKGEARKERLLTHLSPLKGNGLIETWTDRAIPAGSDWRAEIEGAMEAADGAIFLVCGDFLASGFCQDVEVERFLQRHRDDRCLILFVLADDCLWEEFPYLRRFQMVPRDGKPITGFRKHSTAYTTVAREIRDALHQHRAETGLPNRPASPLMDGTPGVRTTAADNTPQTPADLQALLAKLPGQTARLFGRKDELAQLDRWHDHKGVLLWVADGGFGKSALTRWWLERHPFPAPTRFIGHSFYSQGSHNQATSGRGFLLEALRTWSIPHEEKAADAELGRLLAEAAGTSPTLILLDGLEPLQQAAPNDPQLHGVLRDQGIQALFAGLAERPGASLCLATSRLAIPDPGLTRSPYFRPERLDALALESAQALLGQRGVRGTDAELERMAEGCGRHPLALILAGEFCHTFLDDSAAAFLNLDRRDALQGATGDGAGPVAPERRSYRGHAASIMRLFDQRLEAERQPLDRALARCLGLFDRPAPWGALLALKGLQPPIPGLTDALHTADEAALLEALARLRQWGLLTADLTRPDPELDAHPLVREHFGAQLEAEDPAAFRAAHRVLFDWFCTLPDQEQPDTLEALEPLYRAVGHGCRAGAWRSAMKKVYQDRIQRGGQYYTQNRIGAHSSDLSALAGFFPQGWAAPPAGDEPQSDEGLDEADRSWLLADVAFCLMSLGRLEEALGPRRIDVQWCKDAEDWNEFCRSSEGLADLLTPLGRWAEALGVADEALAAAGRIADPERRWQRTMGAHAYRGRALHGLGRLAEAETAFAQAEAVQAQARPHEPRLYSMPGFDYAQLHMERACRRSGWAEVEGRGRDALVIAERLHHLLSQALDHCTRGQALAALGQDDEAATAQDRAVATMQRAGKIEFQPILHLARARFRRDRSQWAAAWDDLAAARRIAEPGRMRSYLADAALLAANLHLDQANAPPSLPEAAREQAIAAEIIHADGYGRCLAPLHLLAARLHHHQHAPDPTRQALTQAEARIRELGQWGLWRELVAVGREIGIEIHKDCPAPGGAEPGSA